MAIAMHNLKGSRGAKNTRKRVGRGNASGKGTTAGRGTKGQSARSGGRGGRALRGLRTVLLQTPKLRGFKSKAKKPVAVSLSQLDAAFDADSTVTPAALVKKGLIAPGNGVKVLASGKLSKKLNVTDCKVSDAAKKKIENAGGEVK